MAKLVTKFGYLKPGRTNWGGYAMYIATREGVDKIDDSKKHAPATRKQKQLIENILRDFPDAKDMLEYEDYRQNATIGNASELITRTLEDHASDVLGRDGYARYIATRPRAERYGSHGLFTDDGVKVQLTKVAEEMNRQDGNIWTAIVSLRREDAQRLGFNYGDRWRDMLRTQTAVISENFKIPMTHLRWYAAFHNESNHPHIYVIIYSTAANEGYLTKQGFRQMRASLAGEIFMQDLQSAAEQQTVHRNKLKVSSREILTDAVARINTGGYDNPKVEQLLSEISDRLQHTKGKKVYGYLPRAIKDRIDEVVEELAKDERIAVLYDLWYRKKEAILGIYSEKLPQRLPLSQNKEFKSIRNAVLQEALHLTADRQLPQDDVPDPEPPDSEEAPDEPDAPGTVPDSPLPIGEPVEQDRDDSTKWWSEEYKQARTALYGTKDVLPDFEKAYPLMEAEALRGNGYAMHDAGKILLHGIGREKDEAAAQAWFQKAHAAFLSAELTAEKKDYFQYRIGKLYSFGYGVEQSYETAAGWYHRAVAKRNPYAAYSLGSLYRRGQGVGQDDIRAFDLFHLAAEHKRKSNAYAMYELGRMYQDGIGTEPDREASQAWYAGAYQGFVQMEKTMNDDKLQYRLGQMAMNGIGTEKNQDTAFLYFTKAAVLKNTDAEYGLGKLLLNPDFEQYAPEQAVLHLTVAAEAGHAAALYTLGKLYLQGKEIGKDVPRALAYLEQAVNKGNPFAAYLLGKMLLQGEDVEPDPLRAEQLLSDAAAQGNPFAAYLLGKAYLNGDVLQQNLPKAVELLRLAADQDIPAAEYILGKLYAQGSLLPKNMAAAVELLTKAALHGVPFAQYLLGKLYLTGEDIPKDIPAAIFWLTKGAEQNAVSAGQIVPLRTGCPTRHRQGRRSAHRCGRTG